MTGVQRHLMTIQFYALAAAEPAGCVKMLTVLDILVVLAEKAAAVLVVPVEDTAEILAIPENIMALAVEHLA